jgi:hypothetical protein
MKGIKGRIMDKIRLILQTKTGLKVRDVVFRPGMKVYFPLFDESEQCHVMPSLELKVCAESSE